jgi:hypothetical protein
VDICSNKNSREAESPEQESEDEEGGDGGDDVAHFDLRPVHHRNVLTRVDLQVVLRIVLKSRVDREMTQEILHNAEAIHNFAPRGKH